MPKREDPLLNHEYDGIREYDNPTPAWWSWMFFGSFVFAIFYFVHYQLGSGVSVEQAYAEDVRIAEVARAARAEEEAKNVSEEKLAALMADPAAIEAGRAKYDVVCLACHGKQGEGGIGPNMTDAYWLHGDGSLMAIRKVVVEGVVEKGMMAWGNVMPPDELNRVVAYIGTMRGKNVAGKAPQGEQH